MNSEKLNRLLKDNNICINNVEEVVYEYILLSVFEDIIVYLSQDKNKSKIMDKLRSFENKEIVVNKLILTTTGMKVSNEELREITKWIIAYFQKKDYRENICDYKKSRLLKEQNLKCNLCKSYIDLETSEYDHIIPWKLVGDELEGNYQMLCKHCNRCKSSSLLYKFIMLFKKG